MSSMFSGNNVGAWLDKGAEAFANLQLDEATQDFKNAVAADAHSVKAQLSLGVIYLFAYQNGASKEPELPPDWLDGLKNLPLGTAPPPLPTIPPPGKSPKRNAQIAHQNATNGAMAEQHLKETLQLEPQFEPAMEYLAALYFWWRDPATELWPRRDDARQWFERILHTNPQHKYAHYMCGVIDSENAMQIIRSTPGYPGALTDESRRSVQAKAGPLLAEGSGNLLRSLEIEPNNSDTMTYLGLVKAEQAYLAGITDDSARLRAEAAEWYGKANQIMEAQAKATGQPWPPGDKASIIFERVPEGSQAGKRPIPPFPPDARLMIPPAPPPPPAFK